MTRLTLIGDNDDMSTLRLTAKQEKYAQLRAIHGLNQTEAYLLSYECEDSQKPTIWSNASRLEADSKVSARIDAIKASVEEKALKEASLSKAYVLEQLHNNALKASQAIPVRDREGNLTGEYTYYPSAVNTAFQLIGKELGMFQESKAPINNFYGDVVINQLALVLQEARDFLQLSPEQMDRLQQWMSYKQLPSGETTPDG